jgi:uncharacterized protein (DUF1919 family)
MQENKKQFNKRLTEKLINRFDEFFYKNKARFGFRNSNDAAETLLETALDGFEKELAKKPSQNQQEK